MHKKAYFSHNVPMFCHSSIKAIWRIRLITFCITDIIGHYNPSVRIINLVSDTSYVVCVNFIYFFYKWRDLQFKVDSERQTFLRNFSWQFLFTLRVFARNLLRLNRRRNTFCILFWCLAWRSNPGFTSYKPIHYLLDYGYLSGILKSKIQSSL